MDPKRLEWLLRHTFIDFQQTSEFIRAPLIFERAEGLYVWDTTGKRYFDAIGGVFVAVLGHRHPRVMEAMRRQMERMTFAPPLHGVADVTLELVERLGRVAPATLNFVKPFSGGSESIEAALKWARQYHRQTGHPHKYKFITLYLSYHGATFAALAAGGGARRKSKFEPHMPGFLKVLSPIQLRDRFPSWEEANRFAAQLVEDVIVNEDPETVAGVLLEPICNTGGIVTPTDEYFRMLRQACDRHHVLLIFDEVLCGMARTGDMFAAQTFGVAPDLLCSGKGLASGAIPIGAMLAREDMAEAFYGPPEAGVQFAHGHTFAGNPLAAAAACAVLDEIVEQKLTEKARRLGDHLAVRLEGLKRLGVVREVRGKGVLRGVELVHDTATNEPFPPGRKLGDALKRTALANGLILRVDPDWFAVSPPLIAEESDLDEMVALIERSLVQALELVEIDRTAAAA
jgi:adenosylmethionine-8-amino-7-oxononanoate aminotransferase